MSEACTWMYLYWPGMSAEMKQYISTCETCRELGQRDTRQGDTDVSWGPFSSLGEDCHRHFYPWCQGLLSHDRLLQQLLGGGPIAKHQGQHYYFKTGESFCLLWHTFLSDQGQGATICIWQVWRFCKDTGFWASCLHPWKLQKKIPFQTIKVIARIGSVGSPIKS